MPPRRAPMPRCCSIHRPSSRLACWGHLLHQFSDWYLSVLGRGRLLAHCRTDGAGEHGRADSERNHHSPGGLSCPLPGGELSLVGIVLAGAAGSWVGASLMYWGARWLGRPLVLRFGPYVGLAAAKIELAERWSAHYGWPGVFFSRLLPVIRHLIGIPAGILRMDFRWYSAVTLAGSLLWCSVLAWLGMTVGSHPELLKGSLHRFAVLVLAVGAVLAALYYLFVQRPASRPAKRILCS